LGAVDNAAPTAARLDAHFGNLRRLARSGFACDDQNRMAPDRPDDIFFSRNNGQGFGIIDTGEGRVLSQLFIQ
jgi:hypothetical protein